MFKKHLRLRSYVTIRIKTHILSFNTYLPLNLKLIHKCKYVLGEFEDTPTSWFPINII